MFGGYIFHFMKVSDGGVTDTGGVINIFSLIELVMDKHASSIRLGARDYFCCLYRQSLPGPLVGISVSYKELTRWIDDKIVNCGSPDIDYRKGDLLRLLFSLLKIACHHKGNLRSPFGTDNALKVPLSFLYHLCPLFQFKTCKV